MSDFDVPIPKAAMLAEGAVHNSHRHQRPHWSTVARTLFDTQLIYCESAYPFFEAEKTCLEPYLCYVPLSWSPSPIGTRYVFSFAHNVNVLPRFGNNSSGYRLVKTYCIPCRRPKKIKIRFVFQDSSYFARSEISTRTSH